MGVDSVGVVALGRSDAFTAKTRPGTHAATSFHRPVGACVRADAGAGVSVRVEKIDE
jgi:hypothetical protein